MDRGHFEPILGLGPRSHLVKKAEEMHAQMTQAEVNRILRLEGELRIRSATLENITPVRMERLLQSDKNTDELDMLYGSPRPSNDPAREGKPGQKADMDNDFVQGNWSEIETKTGTNTTDDHPLTYITFENKGGREMEFPVWDGPEEDRPLIRVGTADYHRFALIDIRGTEYAVPSSILNLTETCKANLPDTMLVYQYLLGRSILPRTNNHQVREALIWLVNDINLRIKISSQKVWRRFKATGNTLLAIAIHTIEQSEDFRSLLKRMACDLGINEVVFHPELVLEIDARDALIGNLPGRGPVTLSKPGRWEPEIIERRIMPPTYRRIRDESFRQEYLRGEERGTLSEVLGLAVDHTDPKRGRVMEHSFGDDYTYDEAWAEYLRAQLPSSRLIRDRDQALFALGHGNTMAGEINKATRQPITTNDKRLPGIQDEDDDEDEDATTPGKALIIQQLRVTVTNIID